MSQEFKEVLSVNEMFYKALGSRNLGLMEEAWIKNPRAKCVHPGWPILLGWEAIKQSWKNIFDSGGPTKIQISNVNVEMSGDLAWITCIEHISYVIRDQVQINMAQATNIFECLGSYTWVTPVKYEKE